MKSASVGEAKNAFSALLDEVRQGETVLIMHRGRPVARIESCRTSDDDGAGESEAELVRRGIASPPRARLDPDRFLATPVPRLPKGVSASRLIVAEREGVR
jgi:prevent-host-death family protein